MQILYLRVALMSKPAGSLLFGALLLPVTAAWPSRFGLAIFAAQVSHPVRPRFDLLRDCFHVRPELAAF
jgi:hypothetical protein